MNQRLIIKKEMTLINALKYMDEIERKLLIICDGDYFYGVISIGDIQRCIIKKTDLNEPVGNHIRNNQLIAHVDDDLSAIKNLMFKNKIESMPVIDYENHLLDIIEWVDIFDNNISSSQDLLNLPVVIMAGGKGERLKPLTNFIPKPLIPVSDKTIIEEIIDRFRMASCKHFYLSVNYMYDLIQEYFNRMQNKGYSVDFIHETKPLGTAGSLFLLRDVVKSTFVVSNCDSIIDVNMSDLLSYHTNNHNSLTMVSVIKNFDVPYGVIETSNNGELSVLKEKPDVVYQVNCGLYILEPIVFDYINDNEFLNITDLIVRIKDAGLKVGVFPISEKSWRDMGNWKEYLRMINET